ncbi:hypothetical protein CVU82_01875 [Candidatus Falkowbacteria bacterium HGW-Falkowbacteria-1]|jgi:cell division septal protein FtsQ|uniref:POTRA domain-containing protein n=1 Tax=Candidatus Falkowbacteria bacterium HGW-Falkowbacteria-1 TaxID=2013768 RepID=A0A2N2E9H0_9BACT|nr:MAG: hypothetical protein CVU82_01875 [Candidatus Falkowbacteria bacterium HGW-Falkowbacteria-1]
MINSGLTKISGKKINNPFMKEKTHRKFRKKCRIIFFSFIIFVLVFVYLTFFSGLFTIKNIKINDLKEVDNLEIENIVKDQINNSKFLFFSEKNLILFNKTKLANSLSPYNFSKIIIKKSLFNTIEMEIEEREVAYILKEGKSYYYLDSDGNIISTYYLCEDEKEETTGDLLTNEGDYEVLEEKVESLDKVINSDNPEINNYEEVQEGQENNCIESIDDFLSDKYLPLMENISSSRLDSDSKYAKINKEYLEFAIKLYNDLGIETDFRAKNFIIDESVDTIKVRLFNDVLVFFSLKDDYNDQIQRFLLLKKEYKDNLKNIEYIDIRYGDKIYYH